jgi:hypothetical protein
VSDVSDTAASNGSRSPISAVCVFVVALLPDGGSQVIIDPEQHFTSQRPSTAKDVFPALANCLADWQGMKTAEAVVNLQVSMARHMAEQVQGGPPTGEGPPS